MTSLCIYTYTMVHVVSVNVDIQVFAGSESSQEFCVLDTVTAHAVRLEQCELKVYCTARLVCVASGLRKDFYL